MSRLARLFWQRGPYHDTGACPRKNAGSQNLNLNTQPNMADELKEKETLTENQEKPESESEGKTEEKEGEHIDYKQIAEEEKARREKAEAVIQRHKEKKEDEQSESYNSPTIDADLIRSVIREEVDELKSSLTSQFRTKEIDTAISKVATDAHHAALVRYHYDNSIRQTGDMELDVENASALANKRKVQSTLEEVKASIESKETRSFGSTAGRKPKVEADDESLPLLTAVDKQSVDFLRQKYVLSNTAIRRILKGDRLDDLLEQGVIKQR